MSVINYDFYISILYISHTTQETGLNREENKHLVYFLWLML